MFQERPKMAALVEGQQYGLSSQGKNSSDKTLIFVKLTDSALNAVERYVRQKSNSLLKPTIQFQGNNGLICMPKDSNSYEKQSFGFTLSNVEADGPQGSFECLRQNGAKSLESLGSMMFKMQIHANEESYEKTRVKMAAVEKENKKFCTKEINPSNTYGRKMKRPISSSTPKVNSPPPSSLASKQPSKTFGTSATSVNQLNSLNNAPRPNLNNKIIKNPELLRQSLRDRIIHLLALRSYKKPELMTRLLCDGIKEKEKKGITLVLSQVALLKGNSYSLANHAWNEVQESWKFYSQEEAECIKQKKQEVLNSNSDSNIQSLVSTQENVSPSQKRTSNEIDKSNSHSQRNKKLRISHFTRPEKASLVGSHVTTNSGSINNNMEKSDQNFNLKKNKNYKSYISSEQTEIAKSNNVNSKLPNYSNHLRKINGVQNGNQKNLSNGISEKSNQGSGIIAKNQCDEGVDWLQPTQKICLKNGYNKHEEDQLSKKSVNNVIEHNQYSSLSNGKMETTLRPDVGECKYSNFNSSNSSVHFFKDSQKLNSYSDKSINNCRSNHRLGDYSSNSYSVSQQKKNSHGSCHTSPNSSCDSQDSVNYNNERFRKLQLLETDFEHTEYSKEYNAIVSGDQRTKYKDDFNAQYEEYLILHEKIKHITERFTSLECELNNYREDSDKYNEIKNMILDEYNRSLKDAAYQEAKKKLHFLHGKLSYIKKLVVEYDNAQCVKS